MVRFSMPREVEHVIDSAESEGAFAEFLDEYAQHHFDDMVNNGEISDAGPRGSDIVIEMDEITPPTFTYGDPSSGGGAGGMGPGK